MPFSQRSGEIASAFQKWLKTNDRTLINGFHKEEIERAIAELSGKSRSPYHKAMELRLAELKENERYIRSRKERFKDRLIGVFIGIFVTVIGGLILWFILRFILPK